MDFEEKLRKEISILSEADEPATKRQLYALYVITKKDYRNSGLTKKEAGDLIKQLNAEKGYTGKTKVKDFKKDLLSYMQKESAKVAKEMRSELNIKGVVGHDPAMYGKDYADKQPKYAFFGGGMGFAWLEYDKRSKLAVKIAEVWREIERPFKEWFLKKYFSSKERQAYEKIGWPLQAMLTQSLAINAKIQWLVADYMKSKGVKKVMVRTRYD